MNSRTELAESLRSARTKNGLSKVALARSAGVTRGTIHNLEAGLTEASPSTISRIQAVVCLDGVASSPGSLAGENELPPAASLVSTAQWLSPRYDPMQMSLDMVLALNGPGGVLEQTNAYLDTQSAADWFEVANSPAYQRRVRAKIPVHDFAKRIAKAVGDTGLDLIGLGVGDGKSETRLAEALVGQLQKGSLHYYLLDISHTLVIVALRHAVAAMPVQVPVFPIHGNFHDLGRTLALQLQPGRHRRRLWTMFGSTFGNLAHEPSFLKDVGACSRSGDLLLLDVSLCWAPASDLDAVRRTDPALTGEQPEMVVRWLTGPFLRYCRGVRVVKLELSVTNRCPMPGSYEGIYTAHVERADGTRHFDVFRARRYDLARLGREMADLGWQPLHSAAYGPAPGHGLLLLERR